MLIGRAIYYIILWVLAKIDLYATASDYLTIRHSEPHLILLDKDEILSKFI